MDVAQNLNLSQPAIIQPLAKMREAFGDCLFVRHSNGFVFTAMAPAIIQPIRDALRSIDVALAKAGAINPAASDRAFSIGLRPSS